MTDIFTHAVMVNALSSAWKNNMRILDIGTGHGYLSFLISQILKQKSVTGSVVEAIDIHSESIDKCKQIQREHFKESNILFESADLGEYLKGKREKYDVILGGYYFDEVTSARLTDQLSQDGVGVWPTRSDHGQALYKVRPQKEKVYLMETLFSMPVVR